MRTILFFLAVLVATSSATSTRAQAVRTFVSAQSGSDGNPCSRSAPCRTFAYAYGQTAAGGEINTLDPGGYTSLTISKAISILSGLGDQKVIAEARRRFTASLTDPKALSPDLRRTVLGIVAEQREDLRELRDVPEDVNDVAALERLSAELTRDTVAQQQYAVVSPGPARYRPLAFIDGDSALLLAGVSDGGTYKLSLATGELQPVSDRLYLGSVTAP